MCIRDRVSGEQVDREVLEPAQNMVVTSLNVRPEGEGKYIALTFDDGQMCIRDRCSSARSPSSPDAPGGSVGRMVPPHVAYEACSPGLPGRAGLARYARTCGCARGGRGGMWDVSYRVRRVACFEGCARAYHTVIA